MATFVLKPGGKFRGTRNDERLGTTVPHTYTAGSKVESDKPLDEMFPDRFVKEEEDEGTDAKKLHDDDHRNLSVPKTQKVEQVKAIQEERLAAAKAAADEHGTDAEGPDDEEDDEEAAPKAKPKMKSARPNVDQEDGEGSTEDDGEEVPDGKDVTKSFKG